MAHDADETDGGRRRVLAILATGCGAAAAGAVGAPALRMMAPRAGASAATWVRAGRLDALRDGEPKRVALVGDVRDAWTLARAQELGTAWLVRRGDAVVAYSAVCPHLGCAIVARAEGGFVCPCHDSRFGPAGERIDGPSPRGMDVMDSRVDGGVVQVRVELG